MTPALAAQVPAPCGAWSGMTRRHATSAIVIAAILVTVSTLLAYRNVLPGVAGGEVYPWGSDTWGHLFKTLYLYREVQQGTLYPDLLPSWYMGLQMLRYHGPLTYYLMAALYALLGDIVVAGNLFLWLTTWLSALSVLLFRRWLRLGPALVAAVLLPWLPDHLRVGFAEGNLPRVLAAAWLPLALYCLGRLVFERSTPDDRMPRAPIVGLALTLALVVVSHAMMGAIFAACLALVALLAAPASGAGARRLAAAWAGIAGGLGLSAWWLLPSLTGGITEIKASALSDAVARFPPTVSLNPLLRLGNPEVFYLGLGLFLAALFSLAHWSSLSPLARSLLVTGLLAAVVSFEGVYSLFTALPLSQFLWPIRFASFGGPALLLGVAASLSVWRWRVLATVAVAAMALDFYPSSALAHGRAAPTDFVAIADELRSEPGWRVAVADLSRLGSKPSHFVTEVGGREQVFGWAYQGARTARAVAALNEAMERGYFAYATDRLNALGVDDVLLAPGSGIAPGLDAALVAAGFTPISSTGPILRFHRDGQPRATQVQNIIFGIGGGAYDAALLFPRIVTGGSPRVDDYTLADLSRYSTLYLSGFAWRNQGRAEALIRAYAAQGGRVVIDLTGAPQDPLARVPKFMGVYAEPVVLESAVTMIGELGSYPLLPFSAGETPWHAFVPQGVHGVSLAFDYMGEQVIGLGYLENGNPAGPIWFLGVNLPYHAFLTQDPQAVRLLETVLGARAGEPPSRTAVILEGYEATVTGYRFRYQTGSGGLLLIPVAHLGGLQATIDGQQVETMALDTLVALHAPGGAHAVTLAVRPTAIHWAGMFVTTLVVMLMLVLLIPWRRPAQSGVRVEQRPSAPRQRQAGSLAAWIGLGSPSGFAWQLRPRRPISSLTAVSATGAGRPTSPTPRAIPATPTPTSPASTGPTTPTTLPCTG